VSGYDRRVEAGQHGDDDHDAVVDAPRWQALGTVCRREGISVVEHARYEVAKIEMAGDWDAFLKKLSRSHRQGTNKAERRLAELGDLRLEILPLPKDAPIYLADGAKPDFSKTASIARVNKLEIVNRYEASLKAAAE